MTQYAPCPFCGGTDPQKLGFTWWGGIIGPRLLSHVKCGTCGKGYNGKKGTDNTTGIVIYCIIVGGFCLALVVVMFAALVIIGAMAR